MPHPIYKREPGWLVDKWRKALLRLHGGCQVCGTKKQLHVHHKRYRPEMEIVDDLRLLCKDHHNQLHYLCPASDKDLPRFTDVFIEGMKGEFKK